MQHYEYLDSEEKRGEDMHLLRLCNIGFLPLMTFTCLHQMNDLYISNPVVSRVWSVSRHTEFTISHFDCYRTVLAANLMVL